MLSVAVLTSLIAPTTLAWGSELHNTVGVVAQSFLNDNAKAQLLKILPQYNGEIRNATVWADEVKNTAVFGTEYLWASSFHYVSTRDYPLKNCSYDDARDCADGQCVIGAIANFTKQAVCDKSGKSGSYQENAIKFLTHFIGDMTQPLHVCGRDRGGSKTPLFAQKWGFHGIIIQ